MEHDEIQEPRGIRVQENARFGYEEGGPLWQVKDRRSGSVLGSFVTRSDAVEFKRGLRGGSELRVIRAEPLVVGEEQEGSDSLELQLGWAEVGRRIAGRYSN